eukprot:Opistho-2@96860
MSYASNANAHPPRIPRPKVPSTANLNPTEVGSVGVSAAASLTGEEPSRTADQSDAGVASSRATDTGRTLKAAEIEIPQQLSPLTLGGLSKEEHPYQIPTRTPLDPAPLPIVGIPHGQDATGLGSSMFRTLKDDIGAASLVFAPNKAEFRPSATAAVVTLTESAEFASSPPVPISDIAQGVLQHAHDTAMAVPGDDGLRSIENMAGAGVQTRVRTLTHMLLPITDAQPAFNAESIPNPIQPREDADETASGPMMRRVAALPRSDSGDDGRARSADPSSAVIGGVMEVRTMPTTTAALFSKPGESFRPVCVGKIQFRSTGRTCDVMIVNPQSDECVMEEVYDFLLSKVFGVQKPGFLVSLLCGHGPAIDSMLSEHKRSQLQQLFSRAVVKTAIDTGAIITTNATQNIATELVGRSLGHQTALIDVVGICALYRLYGRDSFELMKERPNEVRTMLYDDCVSAQDIPMGVDSDLLDCNNSKFIIIDTFSPVDEMNFRLHFEQHLVKRIPAVAVLINGDPTILPAVVALARSNVPIIAVKSTGGAADIISEFHEIAAKKAAKKAAAAMACAPTTTVPLSPQKSEEGAAGDVATAAAEKVLSMADGLAATGDRAAAFGFSPEAVAPEGRDSQSALLSPPSLPAPTSTLVPTKATMGRSVVQGIGDGLRKLKLLGTGPAVGDTQSTHAAESTMASVVPALACEPLPVIMRAYEETIDGQRCLSIDTATPFGALGKPSFGTRHPSNCQSLELSFSYLPLESAATGSRPSWVPRSATCSSPLDSAGIARFVLWSCDECGAWSPLPFGVETHICRACSGQHDEFRYMRLSRYPPALVLVTCDAFARFVCDQFFSTDAAKVSHLMRSSGAPAKASQAMKLMLNAVTASAVNEIVLEGTVGVVDIANTIALHELQTFIIGAIQITDRRMGRLDATGWMWMERNQLRLAWERFALYDHQSRRLRSFHRRISVLSLFFAMATTFLSIVNAYVRNDRSVTAAEWVKQTLYVALLVVSLVSAACTAAMHRFNFGSKWLLVRSSCEQVLKEIYMYRTNQLKSTSTHRQGGQTLALSRQLALIANQLKDSDVTEIDVYNLQSGWLGLRQLLRCCFRTETPLDQLAVETGTSDHAHDTADPELRAWILAQLKERLSPEEFAARYDRLVPDNYVKNRLQPALVYYARKTPSAVSRLRFFHALIYIASAASSLMAALSEQLWIPIATVMSATFQAHIEASQMQFKVVQKNRAAMELDNIRMWWQSLTPVERASPEQISNLVQTTENVIEATMGSWFAHMRAAQEKLKEAKESVEESRKQDADSSKKEKTN